MGYRLTKIYTRTGDRGETGLADGSRLRKDSLRVEAMGDVDELNCQIGVLLTHPVLPEDAREVLTWIQHRLFDLGAELSMPDARLVQNDLVVELEEQLDLWNAALPPLEEFVLPRGDAATAHCHLARAMCRRAERALVSLAAQTDVNPISLALLNRLSDLLFVLSRVLAHKSGIGEVCWQKRPEPPSA